MSLEKTGISFRKTAAFLGMLTASFLLLKCSKNENQSLDCSENVSNLISFEAIRDSAKNGFYRFKSKGYFEAIVVSSDVAGQFYGKIVLQDKEINPRGGLLLSTDLTDAFLWYPEGQKVFLSLKDLYVDQKRLGYSVGSVFTSFGNLSIGRLPVLSTHKQLRPSCESQLIASPNLKTIASLTERDLQTFVVLDSLLLASELHGLSFANYQEDTPRIFYDTLGNKIILQNSGYSDFWDTPMPVGLVRISGVLSRKRNQFEIEIRHLEDVQFN
jgi:hypothetical protein